MIHSLWIKTNRIKLLSPGRATLQLTTMKSCESLARILSSWYWKSDPLGMDLSGYLMVHIIWTWLDFTLTMAFTLMCDGMGAHYSYCIRGRSSSRKFLCSIALYMPSQHIITGKIELSLRSESISDKQLPVLDSLSP